MNKGEREHLIRLARSRARLAKAEAAEREKILLAEVRDLMTREYQARDELWAEAVKIAEEAARKANDLIVARCLDLGIPADQAPSLGLSWQARRAGFEDKSRRAELWKVAQSRLTALTTAAKTSIDRASLETETALISSALESEDAQAFLAQMPSAAELMPSLGLDDLGVKTWQPPEGIASKLVTPTTPADLRRRKVLRAIEAHPGASDREIGRPRAWITKLSPATGGVGNCPGAVGNSPPRTTAVMRNSEGRPTHGGRPAHDEDLPAAERAKSWPV